ncbi:hypothetical protein U2F10_31295 [Leptothoe sp. EHU-05/26/07-4]
MQQLFGAMVNEMEGKVIRTIGFARSKAMLGLKKMTYNLKRYVFWQKENIAEAAA